MGGTRKPEFRRHRMVPTPPAVLRIREKRNFFETI
jgi:hypothetical protein